jgi:hypothetical protein
MGRGEDNHSVGWDMTLVTGSCLLVCWVGTLVSGRLHVKAMSTNERMKIEIIRLQFADDVDRLHVEIETINDL